ncbi:MAG: tetratricopeptide repeat protein [Planctomycetota bacterium]|nr:tetratricopeptide repeat protein [Planctomycetota bacterium]MDI6788513.1 tetratricopeptide repeat protein [Planctomycetota bacterium]
MRKKPIIFAMLSIAITFLGVTSIFGETEETKNTINLSLSAKNWALQIDMDGFEITQNQIDPEHLGRKIMGTLELKGEGEIVMSVFLEKAQKTGDSKVCRDFYWNRLKKSPFTPEEDEIKMYEKGNMALMEYIIEEAGGISLHQKHLNAYISQDGIWIDIHLSKVLWKEEDKELFDKIINTVKIKKIDAQNVIKYDKGFIKQMGLALNLYAQEKRKEAEKLLLDLIKTTKNVSTPYYYLGNVYYYQKDYTKAIEHYQTSLKMDNVSRFLTDTELRITIDNLGMAYGITKNYNRARETFELGIKRYPVFPFFYYNLACCYAEMRNNEDALKYLELSFEKEIAFRETEIYKRTQENLPEALTDPLFQKLRHQDPRFIELLSKYGKG